MTKKLPDNKLNLSSDRRSISPIAHRVKLGCERLLESEMKLIRGKRVGIVTNHSGVLPSGIHIVDALRADSDTTVVALFSPEHGIRGDVPAGKHVGHGIDKASGLPIYSLYGEHKKPEKWMLENVDLLVYDIQDLATRFYTYVSTLNLAMEAAAENDIPFIVLDRPCLISGNLIDGPLLKDGFKSFIGMQRVPILYSMTPGEMAFMLNEENMLSHGIKAELHVVKLENYFRSMWYDETGLDWVNPSPNITSIETAVMYPGTALFEGTNVTEGRGTKQPFRYVGAPFIKNTQLTDYLNSLELKGVEFVPVNFVPRSGKGGSNPKYKNQKCGGVEVRVVYRDNVKPVEVGIAMICAARELYPDLVKFREDGAFDRLTGDDNIREMIEQGKDHKEISSYWKHELREFSKVRKKYFLYED